MPSNQETTEQRFTVRNDDLQVSNQLADLLGAKKKPARSMVFHLGANLAREIISDITPKKAKVLKKLLSLYGNDDDDEAGNG